MYKVAIVGTGRIAHRHAMVIKDHPDLELVAACDLIPEKASEFGRQNKIKSYHNMCDMISNKRPDIVAVCTEAGNHAKVVVDIAGRSLTAIICEKPMALTTEDAHNMIRACETMRTKLFVVKQNRYNLPVLKLREAFEQGRFGKLYLGTIRLRWHRDQDYFDMDAWRGTWKLDGGVIASQASHHVDLLRWMMGPVKWVFAERRTMNLRIEVDDTVVATLGFENGALGVIEATNAAQPKNLEGSISVLGENGTVVIGGYAVNQIDTWEFKKPHKMDDDILRFSENPKKPDGSGDVYGFGHARFYQEVIKNLSGEKNTAVTGEDGLKSLQLIEAIYQSCDTGAKVYLNKETKLGK